MTYPDHMDSTEKKICNRLLKAIAAHPTNLFVRAFDGEEWSSDWTQDAATVKAATGHTDETRWFLSTVDPETSAMRRTGSIWLIHGNQDDLISDSSYNPRDPDAEGIIDALCRAANA